MTTHSFSLLTAAFTHTQRVYVYLFDYLTVNMSTPADRTHQIQACHAMPCQTTHCLMMATAMAVTRLFAIRYIYSA